jgi:integrase
VRKPKADTREKRKLKIADVRKLTAAFSDSRRGRQVRDVVVFMFGTGCRPGEALALKWADVDLDAGTAFIWRSLEKVRRTKARIKDVKVERSVREVPLPPDVVAMLRRHKTEQAEARLKARHWKDHGLVFPSLDPRKETGGPWTVPALRTAWRAELKDTRWSTYSPYVCRHTYASLLKGVIPDEDLARILGNSPRTLIGTYVHTDEDQADRVRQLINAAL